MKIGMHRLRFFILLFAASSLLFHPPSDFEAFAATSDGSVDSTVEINDSTTNGPPIDNIDNFGISVTNIGDLNNDGVNDIAVGANGDDDEGANRGVIYIMLMNTDGSVDETIEINDDTANGPVLDDQDWFGRSIANIGDLNNDGVNDIAVGAANDDNGGSARGAIHIMYMNTDGSVDSTVEINDSTANGPVLDDQDWFGKSIANIGDLNNDGVNDIAVGATGDDDEGANRGAIHIMLMNTDGSIDSTVKISDSTANGPVLEAQDKFGESVANIGDLNNDGVNDIVVGASEADCVACTGTNSGAVYIMFMNTDGSVDSTVEINDSTTNGPVIIATDNLGFSVANIGDLNGDDVNEIAVGAQKDDGSGDTIGAVHIMFMNTDGSIDSTVEINDSTANGPVLSNDDLFGSSIANIGDLDGNGVIDLVVGAYHDDGSGSNRGAVHILFLHETTKPTVTITSTSGDSGDTVYSTTLSYTATFSESVTGFVVGDITVTGTANSGSPAASNFAGSGTTYTFDVVQGSSIGTVLVSIAAGVATDAAGNENTASNTYTLTIRLPSSGTCTRHVILGNCGTIAINNDEYRIIHPWSTIPTTEVMVGEPVSITLSTPHNYVAGKINSVSVYTEIFGSPANYEESTRIYYTVNGDHYVSDHATEKQLFQVAGATHRIVQDPDVKNLEMFEVVFTMVFAKPMDTSHVVVETKNIHGIPETIYLGNALKVIERPIELLTFEEKSKFEIISEPELKVSLRPDIDIEPDMDMLSMDPEPVVSKVTCGNGTMLKDNLCMPNKMSVYFFFNQFMRLFG